MRRAADAIASKVQGRQLSSEVLEKCPMTIKVCPMSSFSPTLAIPPTPAHIRSYTRDTRLCTYAIPDSLLPSLLIPTHVYHCPPTTPHTQCTPKKDAQTTASLAAKSGYLRKRNEQGQWQSRFLCTVPHMFLYYFDGETAEAPRAVIDLEMYHNVTRTNNTLKLATFDEENVRAFYLQGDDSAELNEWLSHLLRDRYVVCCMLYVVLS
jgi:hypothetical protein